MRPDPHELTYRASAVHAGLRLFEAIAPPPRSESDLADRLAYLLAAVIHLADESRLDHDAVWERANTLYDDARDRHAIAQVQRQLGGDLLFDDAETGSTRRRG